MWWALRSTCLRGSLRATIRPSCEGRLQQLRVADDKAGVSYDGATRSWRLTGKDLALSFPKMPEGFVWTAERSSDGADLTRTGLTRAQVVALRDRLTVVLA